MAVETIELVLSPKEASNEALWSDHLAHALKVDSQRIREYRLLKRSIDARKSPVRYRLRIEVGVDQTLLATPTPEWSAPQFKQGSDQIIIVGCGPAGMFAALRCLEQGIKPVILERGKDASIQR